MWARSDAFPAAPEGWGWTDRKGGQHPVDSLDALAISIRLDRDAPVDLVWTPDHPAMVVPEEVPSLFHALFAVRRSSAAGDLDHAKGQLKLFGFGLLAMLAYTFYQDHKVHTSANVGLALMSFVMFALIPWYQAWKRSRELHEWTPVAMESSVPVLRFETWLDLQKSPATRFVAALMVLVGVAQLVFPDSIRHAGLDKIAYHKGETWRLLTAPFLHGGLLHWFMNMGALLYLGRRVEVFARWPHVPLVFLFSAWVGGEASARFIETISVGASGGLMGWLGFLMVFETLHARLVPRSSRRRLLAGIVLTGVIGLIGYKFIDNAAHAGGLLAGMAYAAIVFPASSSAHRPLTTITDKIVGTLAMLAMAGSAVLGVVVMRP